MNKYKQASLSAAGRSQALLSKNLSLPCASCADTAELQAVILYPALGTPLVAPAEEKRIRLFLIVEDKCVEQFGIQGCEAPFAWHFINTHLRIYPFAQAHKTSADLQDKRLYTSPAAAQAGISVRYKGRHGHEPAKLSELGWKDRLINHQGHIVANIRHSALNLFINNQISTGRSGSIPLEPAFHSVAQVADTRNQPLPHLFEIELAFDALTVKPQPDTMYTLAWMVTCVYRRHRGSFKSPVSHWEHQDKLVYDFFAQMQRTQQHFAEPFCFELQGLRPDRWPGQKLDEAHRIKPFHPFIFKNNKPRLDIGHLTDLHFSCRQFALAQADAAILEGISEPVGPKLANGIHATFDLVEQFRSGADQVDALFLTGDLVDFNRNLAPEQVKGAAPKDQWPLYNLANKLDQPGCYPRGLDDMLCYSLVHHAYTHNLPVFMVTGNHEAYDEPFGISPRVNSYASKLAANPSRRAFAVEDALGAAKDHEPQGTLKSYDPNQSKGNIDLDWCPNDMAAISKANEGIPADHNLTIYEACLIYGPTFAQIMQSWNFMPDNFDWFFTLFTPLADFAVPYNDQLLSGLEWGDAERMLEGSYKPSGLLPRAIEALNARQLALLRNACERQASQHLLFTHFTSASFNPTLAFTQSAFCDTDKVSDEENYGTFTERRMPLFQMLDQNQIHGHYSGHSHRSGAYKVDLTKGKVYGHNLSFSGKDPAKQIPDPATRCWVGTNCGGMGVQNLEGELYGWSLMPPAGYRIAGSSGRVARVVQTRSKRYRPRFCVALDYLQSHQKKTVMEWRHFHGHLELTVHHIRNVVPFIKAVTFYSYDSKLGIFTDYLLTLDRAISNRTSLHYVCRSTKMQDLLQGLKLPYAFVKVEFNQELANVTGKDGAKLYDQYNFDDPWIFRVRANGMIDPVLIGFDREGEEPDWKWLVLSNPKRYPPRDEVTVRSGRR